MTDQQGLLILPGTSEDVATSTGRWFSVVSGAASAFTIAATATSESGSAYRCNAGATSNFYASAYYKTFRAWNCEATFKFVVSANTSFEALFGLRSAPFNGTGQLSAGRTLFGIMASLNATTFGLLSAGNSGTQVSSTATVTLPTAGIPIFINLRCYGDFIKGTYWCETTPTRVVIDWQVNSSFQPTDTGGGGTNLDNQHIMIGMAAKSAAARNIDVANIWVRDLDRRMRRTVGRH